MAMRPPVGAPTLNRRTRILLIAAGVLVLLLLGGSRLITFYVDWLWFGEVGYRSVFTTIIFTRVLQFLLGAVLIGGAVALSLWIAYRFRPVFVPVSGPEDPIARYRTVIISRLRLFGIGIPLLVGLIAGLAAQGDWETVQQFLHSTAVRGHRPRVRHRHQLLRLRAAVLPVGARLAVHRGHDQLHRRAGRPLHVRRHPPHGPRRAGVARRARPPRRARRRVRAAQGRRLLPRPLRAAVLDTQPDVHRCHLHRPERGACPPS